MIIAGSIIIHVDGKKVLLRPSLRYAICLVNRSGGFQRLAREISEGSLTAAIDIVEPHVDLGRDYLGKCLLDRGIGSIQPQLMDYLLSCAGIEPDNIPEETRKPSDKPLPFVPFGEYLQSLYRIGTGWLGWSPAVTLDATPLEITEAHKGRMEMLRSIFGGQDAPEKPENNYSLDDKFRAAFSSFGTRVVKAGSND